MRTHRREKQQVPWKMSRGIPSFFAVLPVQGSPMSEIMQLAGISKFERYSSTVGRSMAVALKKLMISSLDGKVSRLSQPSGRPASLQGKGSSTRRIGRPDAWASSTLLVKRAALRGVVMRLVSTPRAASRRAMSTMGIICPWAISGISTKWPVAFPFPGEFITIPPAAGVTSSKSQWKNQTC
ncbi:unnamed protein product [Spirodela intermedia]|uniref:Uncharacterized protein n=1 Tax=Spirodela intermedia TaxID=51605 RepID=A0A7I8KZK1_SPIIN|nr:unnamed protein product [Spirodela intermedia]